MSSIMKMLPHSPTDRQSVREKGTNRKKGTDRKWERRVVNEERVKKRNTVHAFYTLCVRPRTCVMFSTIFSHFK